MPAIRSRSEGRGARGSAGCEPWTMTGVHESQPQTGVAPGSGVPEMITGPEAVVSGAGSFEKMPATRSRSEGRGADPSTMTGRHSEQEHDGVVAVGTWRGPWAAAVPVGWHAAHGEGAVAVVGVRAGTLTAGGAEVAWHWVHGACVAVGTSRVAAGAVGEVPAPGLTAAPLPVAGVGVPGPSAYADGHAPGAVVVADVCTMPPDPRLLVLEGVPVPGGGTGTAG
jgi:hypothetical protein